MMYLKFTFDIFILNKKAYDRGIKILVVSFVEQFDSFLIKLYRGDFITRKIIKRTNDLCECIMSIYCTYFFLYLFNIHNIPSTFFNTSSSRHRHHCRGCFVNCLTVLFRAYASSRDVSITHRFNREAFVDTEMMCCQKKKKKIDRTIIIVR